MKYSFFNTTFANKMTTMTCCVIVTLAVLPTAVANASQLPRANAKQMFLLALGDSLAAGYQPTYGSRLPPVNLKTGYPDVGYPGSYPSDIASARHLRLLDLGCPGETSSSFLSTPAKSACKSIYTHEFRAKSQMQAALSFLSHHPDAVSLVTLDIGSNDVDHCVANSNVNVACALQAETTLNHNFNTIATKIAAAIHRYDPHARILTMNDYDPFLGLAVHPGGSTGTQLATESLIAVNAFNQLIASDAHHVGFLVADVGRSFDINALVPLVSYRGRRLPKDVVVNCELTWMCPAPTSRLSADIHPNRAGYQTIATAFERLLPKVK